MLQALSKAHGWLFSRRHKPESESEMVARRLAEAHDQADPILEQVAPTHVLITHEGGILCVDPLTGELTQRSFEDANYEPACCSIADGAVTLRASPTQAPALRGRAIADRDGVIGLCLEGGYYLCASPHLGPVSTASVALDAWERLMPLSLADVGLLRAFAARRWLIDEDARPTARHSLALSPGFRALIGGRSCLLTELLALLRSPPGALHPSGLPMSFVFFHETCTPARALLFEPLIYSTISGSDYFFDQYELSVRSIERFGQYDGSYLLVSDRDDEDVIVGFSGVAVSRRACLKQDFPTLDRLMGARREALRHPAFAGFQPVLYVDSDVICDAPIEGLLVAAVRCERVVISAEHDGQALSALPPEDRNWFGGFLYAPNDPALLAHRCVNSGLFGGRNRETLDTSLTLVERAWALYKAAHGDLHQAAFDQPFFSFVLQTLELAEIEPTRSRVRILNDSEPGPDSAPVGLAHFNIGVGRDKIDAMRRYFGLLDIRAFEMVSET
ncbi:hypothetical protein [Lichenicoccus sp.]|uniref:hypothetical protein n=1 Tax=Lichenicoccus sp. TaxID=2781899 RepID=UPI003D150729